MVRLSTQAMEKQDGNLSLVKVPQLERLPWLCHGFGDARWDEHELHQLAARLGIRPVLLNQVHSDCVHFIEEAPKRRLRGDAAVTRLGGLLLVIRTADCLPVLLVEERRRITAAVHCGWKGTSRRFLEKVIQGMRVRYGASPEAILAALGPCIGEDCYEVGTDVRGAFAAAGLPSSLFRPSSGRSGKSLLDLRAANRFQLLGQGVKPDNIFSISVCTHCDPRYPSYRRDKDACGRMLSIIGLSA